MEEEQHGDMVDMARCLVQMAEPQTPAGKHNRTVQNYECKTCRKSFTSSQALGGHRASHSYRRARSRDQTQHQNGNTSTSGKPRAHSCSVCGYEFSSGQALGGHMRKHRQLHAADVVAKTKTLSFDLNLPLVEEGDDLDEDGSY